jgi:uncharacterized protein
MFFVAILTLMISGDVLWWIWADARLRQVKAPRWRRVWRALLGVFCGALLGYLVFFILFPTQGRNAHRWMPLYPLASVYVWHLFVLPATLLGLLIIGSIVRLVRWRRKTVPNADASYPNESPPIAMGGSPPNAVSRRALLTAAAVATPPLLLGGAVSWSVSRLADFRIRRFELGFAELPADLDGVTIAQLSDVHVGRFTRAQMLPAIVDAMNNLKADLVAFTGDLIDLALGDLPVAMDMMKRLDPRSGMFIVEGNHDLIDDPLEFHMRMRAARLPLLLDETAMVLLPGRSSAIQILGMAWSRSGGSIASSMSSLLRQRSSHAFPILLAHHPHAFDAAAQAKIPLTLSGHTHGGQLMLNERLGAGPAMFRYWSGLYQKPAGSKLIVSNGVGNWFPLRINAPAEIVHITLRKQ